MSFINNNLSVIAYSNGFTCWHYHSNDDVDISNSYFDKAHELLKCGDLVIVNLAKKNGKFTKHGIYFVTESKNRFVSLAPAF